VRMPESSSEVFVSISRASQLLEAPERTVRRMADKLADTDRQLADTGGQKARLVRLSALAHLMGREIVADSGRHSDDSGSTVTQESADLLARIAELEALVADSGRQLADKEKALSDKEKVTLEAQKAADVAEAEKRGLEARLADTQAERDRLIKEKAEDSEKFTKVLEALQRAQDETRAARVMSSGRVVQQIEASGLAGDAQSEVSAAGGGITTPSATEEPKRGFWARLRGRG
jgi:hypothetical protein